jgi:exodeoxyribonuclease V gamma subunit
MLRLVYSNRTEELLAALAERVRAQQASEGALVPVRIVVPSITLEQYLRLGVARACGIAANLETVLLTRFAAETVAESSSSRVCVVSADSLEAMALALLLDEAFVEDPDLGPVRGYLRAVEGRDAAEMRRVQLAARIGRLFEEYTYSRGEMLAEWSQGRIDSPTDSEGGSAGVLPARRPTTLDVRHRETERWQRRFWLAMFGDGGIARARSLIPLHEAVSRLAAADAGARRTVHVFGFGHFAPTFHRLISALGRAGEVVVYSLSPCEGFWEDVDPRDPPPVHLWARPGREHVRALDAAAAFDHEDRFVEPARETLIGQLQHDLLRREPVRETVDPRFSFERDASIRVLEHASIRRELEAVASEIWELVMRDDTLRFDDIGVLLPDAEAHAYLPHLPAVFGEAHEIPHQIVGVPLLGESRVVEAIELLLALPLGRFTRQELLRLAVHPAVVASLDDVDPQRWLAWCDALGVVHGADRADHQGTYIEGDLFNWDQGLRRLALGAFMAGDASGERSPFEVGRDAYAPHEITASELRDAAALGLLLRSLIADSRFARDASLTMKEWARLFGALVETYVSPPAEADAEPLAQCLRELHALGEVDLGEKRVSYRIASELARARIDGVTGGRGGRGVVVSRIAAMRAVPMRIVFACGLGEGRFPSGEAEDSLDLRWTRRQAGDVTARERDKYAFLELLLCVRERFYASYVSRDPLTGDALAPSSVVQELLHTLERGYVRDGAGLRRRHPLRRWDPVYHRDLFPGAAAVAGEDALPMHLPQARAEARMLAVRRRLEARGIRLDASRIQARAETSPAWGLLAESLGLARLPAPPLVSEERIVVPIYALVKFLEFPLQGWARFRVGLDETEEDDILAREDEPFETDLREETLLLREVLWTAAAGDRSLGEAYDATVRDRELRGSGPSGVFAQGERADHLTTLEAWRDELESAQIPLGGVEVHRFGRAGEHSRADHVHEPLVLDLAVVDERSVERVVRAEIVGRALPLAAEARTSITLLRRAKERRDDDWARAERERTALRAFVDHAVLSATGALGEQPHSSLLVISTSEGAVTERRTFDPLTRGEATVWLRDVVRELLGGPHAYFFPCEAIFVRQRVDPEGPVVPWLEQARDKLRDKMGPLPLRSAYGPVPRPHEYPLPDERRAQAMIARRFGPLFAKRKEKT